MKKTISNICLVMSGLIILDSAGASHYLTLFLLAGVVPGTNLLISPIDMMAASATAITIVILRIAIGPKLLPSVVAYLSAKPIAKKTSRRHLA